MPASVRRTAAILRADLHRERRNLVGLFAAMGGYTLWAIWESLQTNFGGLSDNLMAPAVLVAQWYVLARVAMAPAEGTWRERVTARLAFVAIVCCLPFAVSDVVILHFSGFTHPVRPVWLAWRSFNLALLLIPAMALAVIHTRFRTFARNLAILCAAVVILWLAPELYVLITNFQGGDVSGIFGFPLPLAWLPGPSPALPRSPWEGDLHSALFMMILAVVSLAALAWRYSGASPRRAGLALAMGWLLLFGADFTLDWPAEWLDAKIWPPDPVAAAATVRFVPAAPPSLKLEEFQPPRPVFALPLVWEGLPPGAVAHVGGVDADLGGPVRRTVTLQALPAEMLPTGQLPPGWLLVFAPQPPPDRATVVTLQVTAEIYGDPREQQTVLTGAWQQLAGVGRCAGSPEFVLLNYFCVAAYRTPAAISVGWAGIQFPIPGESALNTDRDPLVHVLASPPRLDREPMGPQSVTVTTRRWLATIDLAVPMGNTSLAAFRIPPN